MSTPPGSNRIALQGEVDQLRDTLATGFSSGELGRRPAAFQHHARVLRQASARLDLAADEAPSAS